MPAADTSNMVLIPAGDFIMGDDRFERERPQRTAWVGEFFMDRYVVTNHEFQTFLEESGYPVPTHWGNSTFPTGRDDHPGAGARICNACGQTFAD
jgi:formylglycine-generating enzyme required for sulfatase activity